MFFFFWLRDLFSSGCSTATGPCVASSRGVIAVAIALSPTPGFSEDSMLFLSSLLFIWLTLWCNGSLLRLTPAKIAACFSVSTFRLSSFSTPLSCTLEFLYALIDVYLHRSTAVHRLEQKAPDHMLPSRAILGACPIHFSF